MGQAKDAAKNCVDDRTLRWRPAEFTRRMGYARVVVEKWLHEVVGAGQIDGGPRRSVSRSETILQQVTAGARVIQEVPDRLARGHRPGS